MDGMLKPKKLKDFFLPAHFCSNKKQNNINGLTQKPHPYWVLTIANQKYPRFINMIHAWRVKNAVFKA
jgi:hypothetical protein